MSESDFTPNKPFVLRVEISAEQASTLVPLFEGRPVLPAMPATPAPISEEAVEMTAFEDFVIEEVLRGRSILGLYPATDDQTNRDFADWRVKNGR